MAIDALCCWADKWQLSVSVNKCCVLNVDKADVKTDIYINEACLPAVESARDLGVLVTKDLSSQLHVKNVVSRAHKRAAAILRAFLSRDVNLLMRAFLVYVRPIVEYNIIIWSPSAAHDIDAVESVQRSFTKRLHGLKHLSYSERLKCLNVPSLELRRRYNDLFWCYKIVFGLANVRSNDFFVLSK